MSMVLQQSQELSYKKNRLNQAIKKEITNQNSQFQNQLNKLSILNPLETMKRGYSITFKGDEIIKSTRQVAEGDALKSQ